MAGDKQYTGDPRTSATIDELEGRFGSRIYFLALRELRSPALAEDVRNETLLRVIEALREGKVRTVDSIGAFVAGVTRNVIREQMRKDPLRGAEPEVHNFADGSIRPAVDHTERRALRATLEKLSGREREVIRLVFYEELPREEIADRLGIAPERVRLAKSRALQTFREHYHRLTRVRRKDGQS